MNMWKMAALAGGLSMALAGAVHAVGADGQAVVAAAEPQAARAFAGGGRLGVTVREAGEDDLKRLGGSTGVVIENVRSGSPAEKAGFKDGDVVVEFDGERVRSVRQFTRLVQETAAGRAVSASVLRDGQRTTVTVELAEAGPFAAFREFEMFRDFGEGFGVERPARPARPARPPAPPAPPAPPTPPAPPGAFEDFELFVRQGATLGIRVTELPSQLAAYFGASGGVLVASVEENSPAAKAGVKAGDVITAVNGSAVKTAADVRRSVARLASGAEFTVDVVREKKTTTLKGKMEERQTRRRVVV